MYKKYLIVASKKDKAGINITTQLSQFPRENFTFYLVEDEIINTENLDFEKINSYDFIIFASKHASEKSERALTVHAPGNWRSADLGGEREKVCKSSALFMKQLFIKLKKNADSSGLGEKYKVTLEATHHGPLINKPCVFIEIGSTQTEWEDRKAGFVIAKTILETIKTFEENPYNEVAIGVGGPHYCPNFNRIQLNSNVAISHVIPQYAFPLTEEMIKEAIEKTEEEVDFILVDWKGMGKSESKQQALEILDKMYLQYKKTSQINK